MGAWLALSESLPHAVQSIELALECSNAMHDLGPQIVVSLSMMDMDRLINVAKTEN